MGTLSQRSSGSSSSCATGARAVAMSPVAGAREKVGIEQKRVQEVLERELQAREAHGKAAQELVHVHSAALR